jgi:4-carboxymuconolactone decarboxylase
MGLIDDPVIREKTKRTSAALFKGVRMESGFDHWKRFDKGLARDLSLFYTGVLYSREVISQKQRELCAVASLTALHRPKELHVHIHAALNVGATRREVAEVIFQQAVYGGMPVVVDALETYGRVLAERGEPFPDEETA